MYNQFVWVLILISIMDIVLFMWLWLWGVCFSKDVKCLINISVEKKYIPKILLIVDEVNESQKCLLLKKLLINW